jgi:hypothetical protein
MVTAHSDSPTQEAQMARNNQDDSNTGTPDRDRYRDNDDVREPVPADQRAGTNPDSKSEARGNARENVGNHSRGTAAAPTVGGNDKTKHRDGENR